MSSPAEYYHTSQFGIKEVKNPFPPEPSYDELVAKNQHVAKSFMDALDASNMVKILRSYASASAEQAEEIFQGDAAPYTQMIEGLTWDQLYDGYKTMGMYFSVRGEQAKLGQLVHHFTRFATIDEAQDINDQVAGLNHQERLNGWPKMSSKLERSIIDNSEFVTRSVGPELEALIGKVIGATHLPSVNMFHGFVANTNGDPEVRKVMMGVVRDQAHDSYLAAQKVRIMGKSIALRKEAGMDTDSYLNSFGAPTSGDLEQMIKGIFNSEAFKQEYKRRLGKTAPQALEKFQRGERISYEEVLDERSETLGLPEEFPSVPDLEAAARQVNRMVVDSTRLDLSKERSEGPRIIVPITSERAGNVVYKNRDGKDIETIALDPYRFSYMKNQIGHEDGHKDHYAITKHMEERSPETTIPWEENPRRETVAQKKGNGVAQVISHPLESTNLDGSDDIEELMRAARMGLTALNQLFVQKKLDELHDAGVNTAELSVGQAKKIAREVERQTNKVVSDTFGMDELFHAGAANTLTPEFLLDGIVYTGALRGLIADNVTMLNVVEKRVGYGWWGTEAGQVLSVYYDFLTTQKGYTDDQIIEAVSTVDVVEARQTLAEFGITLKPQEQEAA